MAEPGAVSWQFERKGVVTVPRSTAEDDLMSIVLDAGADDLRDEGEFWMLIAEPSEFHALRTALEAAGIPIDSAELQMLPTQTVAIGDESGAKKVLRLLELFEDNEDVQNVYANFDIPDEIFEAAMA